MDVLLTWVGSRDPYWDNTRTGKKNDPGPILSLLKQRRFGVVYLLFNLDSAPDDFRRRATMLQRYVGQYWPTTVVKQRPVELRSVIDHREIFRVTNHECQAILREQPGAQLHVLLSPGTPAMHTVWVLLVQSGLLPATMLQTTAEDQLKGRIQVWESVDLSIPDFPQVVNPGETARVLGILEAQNENLTTENRWLKAELRLRRAGGESAANGAIAAGFKLRDYLTAHEAKMYTQALEQAKGNGAEAAKLLGIEPHTFRAGAERLGVRTRRRSKRGYVSRSG